MFCETREALRVGMVETAGLAGCGKGGRGGFDGGSITPSGQQLPTCSSLLVVSRQRSLPLAWRGRFAKAAVPVDTAPAAVE